jgi:hypothetical protein
MGEWSILWHYTDTRLTFTKTMKDENENIGSQAVIRESHVAKSFAVSTLRLSLIFTGVIKLRMVIWTGHVG